MSLLISDPKDYLEAVRRGSLGGAKVSGLVGRVLRGVSPADFETLTNEPNKRKIVLLTDEQGLANLVGKGSLDMLRTIGYEDDYTRSLIDSAHKGFSGRHQFKLVVMPAGSAEMARWLEMLRMAQQAWPELAKHNLPNYAFALQKKSGIEIWDAELRMVTRGKVKTIKELKALGETHPLYMTPQRLADDPRPSVLQIRIFLYLYCFLTELYSGDGRTYDEIGYPGLNEYCILNQPISQIPGAVVYDMRDISPSELP